MPKKIKDVIIHNISNISKKEQEIYMPFILNELKYDHHSKKSKELLIKITENNYNLRSNLINQLLFYLDNNNNLSIYKELISELIINNTPIIKHKLYKTYKFIKHIKLSYKNYNFSMHECLQSFSKKI